MAETESPRIIRALLETEEVVEMPALQKALGGVSVMTVFRHLRKVPYRTSYNHRGRYYALHDPSRYDGNGLWHCGDIRFSRDGSLRQTVKRLVWESAAGKAHRELRERLGVRVQNTLLDLLRAHEVSRERLAEIYIYFHVDAVARRAQHAARHRQLADAAEREFTDADVIQVLLVLLRHRGSTPADVVRRLRGHAPPIGHAQVEAIFARYDLGEKGGPSAC